MLLFHLQINIYWLFYFSGFEVVNLDQARHRVVFNISKCQIRHLLMFSNDIYCIIFYQYKQDIGLPFMSNIKCHI